MAAAYTTKSISEGPRGTETALKSSTAQIGAFDLELDETLIMLESQQQRMVWKQE